MSDNAVYAVGYYYQDQEGIFPEFWEPDLTTAQATTNLLNSRERKLYTAFMIGIDFMRENQHVITQENYMNFRQHRDDLIKAKLQELKLENFLDRTLKGEFFRYRYAELQKISYLELS